LLVIQALGSYLHQTPLSIVKKMLHKTDQNKIEKIEGEYQHTKYYLKNKSKKVGQHGHGLFGWQ